MNTKSTTGQVLIIVIVLLTLPIWLGIGGGLFHLFTGLVSGIFGIFTGLISGIFGIFTGLFNVLISIAFFPVHVLFGGFCSDGNDWQIGNHSILKMIAVVIIITLIINRKKRIN